MSVRSPSLLILPVVMSGAILLILSPQARFAFVVLGGMAVLQTSDNLDLPKMAYLAGAFL